VIQTDSGTKTVDELLTFLETRKGLLDAVVLSGGECTLYPDLVNLCRQIKLLGFKIKVDTNGSIPSVIKTLLDNNLVDFVAMDIKANSDSNYKAITKASMFKTIEDTIKLLEQSSIPYECRTTVHSNLLSENDILECISNAHSAGFRGAYGIQMFSENNGDTVNNLSESKPFNIDYIQKNSKLPLDLRNFN